MEPHWGVACLASNLAGSGCEVPGRGLERVAGGLVRAEPASSVGLRGGYAWRTRLEDWGYCGLAPASMAQWRRDMRAWALLSGRILAGRGRCSGASGAG